VKGKGFSEEHGLGGLDSSCLQVRWRL